MSVKPDTLRVRIDDALRAEDQVCARQLLQDLWRDHPSLGTASYVAKKQKILLQGKPVRVAILRSFTIEPFLPVLHATAGSHNLPLEVQCGQFNTWFQELAEATSWMEDFRPHVVILAVRASEMAPLLWEYSCPLNANEASREIQRVTDLVEGALMGFRARHSTPILLHNCEIPTRLSGGVFDQQRKGGQIDCFRQLNCALFNLAQRTPDTFLLDYEMLVADYGRNTWTDDLKWITARMPLTFQAMMALADELVRYLLPLAGLSSKVVVTDLDNTLWGGILGEDGPNGIRLAEHYPGVYYRAVQKVLAQLRARGILLAVCSKNNEYDALEVMNTHPAMLLRSQDFSSIRINWTQKAENIKDIALELNLGLEHFSFLDDDPAERAAVRMQLPQVNVLELDSDPAMWARQLSRCPELERLSLSNEDQQRHAFYQHERCRNELKSKAASLEDFYQSLELKTVIRFAAPEDVTRVAQLTQKTNQFNLTTRRYQESELVDLLNDPSWKIFCLSAADRFGVHGLTGVAMCKLSNGTCTIDTFLLSCRIIGRGLEKALLTAVETFAIRSGCQQLVGTYYPTPKNMLVRDFYESCGFVRFGPVEQKRNLGESSQTVPSWITATMDF